MDAMEDGILGISYDEGYGYTPRREIYPIDTRSKEIANTLRGLLKSKGILTNKVHNAGSGSCYISFHDEEMGQCRVGNHEEKGRLGYRWQIRLDLGEKRVSKNKGHSQFYYPSNDLESAVNHMVNYYNKIFKDKDEFECV